MSKGSHHSKFKVFPVDVKNGKLSAADKKSILKFTNQPEIHAHSIGSHHVPGEGEDATKLVVTVGYSEKKKKAGKERNYDLTIKKLGTGFDSSASKLEELEQAFETAASKLENVICHEFFVTENVGYALFLHEHEAE